MAVLNFNFKNSVHHMNQHLTETFILLLRECVLEKLLDCVHFGHPTNIVPAVVSDVIYI